MLGIKGFKDTLCIVKVISYLAGEQVFTCREIDHGALADDLCLVGDYSGGQIITADLYDFDVGFSDGRTCRYILDQTNDLGLSVRESVDQGCDAETNCKCDHNADDSDDCAVAHGMRTA